MRKTLIIDDYDGETTENVRPVTLILDTERWNLDLSPASLKALKDALKPFTTKTESVRLDTPRRRTITGTRRPGITQWLRDNGYPEAKGRPTAEQTAAYDAAH
jgi:hypothetical protein